MHYYPEQRKIVFEEKVLNALDRFTLDFIKILEDHTSYVLVSGYVSILLGRSRSSEDVDFLIPPLSFSQFSSIFNDLLKRGYECANTTSIEEAYSFLNDFAVRFFIAGFPTPNIEFKIIKTDLDRYAFENKLQVILKDCTVYISPLELQIAFKLLLAADGLDEELQSDKDIEDARHLYRSFQHNLNKDEFLHFVTLLGVTSKVRWLT